MPKSLLDTFPDKYNTVDEFKKWIKEMSKNKTLKQRSTDPGDKMKYKILQELIKAFQAHLSAITNVEEAYKKIEKKTYSNSETIDDAATGFLDTLKAYDTTTANNNLNTALLNLLNRQGQAFGCNIPTDSHDIKRNKSKFTALLKAYDKFFSTTDYTMKQLEIENAQNTSKEFYVHMTHPGFNVTAERFIAPVKEATNMPENEIETQIDSWINSKDRDTHPITFTVYSQDKQKELCDAIINQGGTARINLNDNIHTRAAQPDYSFR